jgi:hypothetical protein
VLNDHPTGVWNVYLARSIINCYNLAKELGHQMVRNLILGTVFVLLVGLAGYTVLFKPEGSNFGPSSKKSYGHGGNFRN